MLNSVRPFFSALEINLHQCLPQDEYRHVIDEALEEMEGLVELDRVHNLASREPLLRFCNIALAVYRGMVKVGLDPEIAQYNIAKALEHGQWRDLNPREKGACLAAIYFHGKSALELCENTFCLNCARHETGCPVTGWLRKTRFSEPTKKTPDKTGGDEI